MGGPAVGGFSPAQTLSFTKCKFLQVNNFFAIIVDELSVLKLFQLSNGNLIFSLLTIYYLFKTNV